jgi:curved DNA-binding protein CbpA
MAGQLNEHPLGELIREIHAAGLSGALRLYRERAKAVVYFDSGEIIYAASNLRTYRLSECVRRWGVFDKQQLPIVQETMSDLDFGAAMVKSGALSRESLGELIAHQVSEMLCHALLWIDGEWDFDVRVRLADDMRVELKMNELLMESARRLPVEFVTSRFKDHNEKLSLEEDAPDNLALLPAEAFVLTRVDAPTTVNDLLAVGGLPEADALQVIYTLASGGLLRRDGWPQAFTKEEISRAQAAKVTSPKPVKAEPKIVSKSAPQIKATPVPEEKPDEKAELAALFARLKTATNFYQMLGVVRPAGDADIKRAYHSLAKRFHPDRFRKSVDDTLHARIESAFAQIAHAYEALKDKQVRAVYDSKLLTQEQMARASNASREPNHSGANLAKATSTESFKPTDSPPQSQFNTESTPADAEERFQQGLSALQRGNNALALTCLGEAARLLPSQPRYRAYYGRALANEERLRRSAEAEIKAAITLDANNSSYRVMLAELYIEIGLLRRAQGELERALSIDPGNNDARNLLDKMKG